MKRISLGLAAVALVGAGLAGCSDDEYVGEKWTYLVYLHADNNLDSAAVDDISEMLEAGGSGARFVVQIDRSPEYGQRVLEQLPFEEEVQRLVIQDGKLEIVEELGELDSGDADNIEDFITWGLASYPSERMAMVFWDHGGGWVGFGHDETDGSGTISTRDMADATQRALATSDRETFDLLGFDACLMGNLEVALTFKDLTSYYLGSEENEPGHGWDYKALRIPTQEGNSDPISVGTALIDGFEAQAKKKGTDVDITLSLIDQSKVQGVADALFEGARLLAGEIDFDDPSAFGASEQVLYAGNVVGVVQASKGVPDFGGEFTHLIDVSKFGEVVSAAGLNTAADINTAVTDAVIYNVNGPYHEGAGGLSVYLPPNQHSYSSESYAEVDSGGWSRVLDAWVDLGVSLEDSTSEPEFVQSEPVVEVVDDKYAFEAQLFVDLGNDGVDQWALVNDVRITLAVDDPTDDSRFLTVGARLGAFDPVSGVVTAEWGGEMAVLYQGEIRVPISAVTVAGAGGLDRYLVAVQYESQPGASPVDLLWGIFVDEDNVVTQTSLYRAEVQNLGTAGCEQRGDPGCTYSVAAWEPRSGSVLKPQYIARDKVSGDLSRVVVDGIEIDPFEEYSFVAEPVPVDQEVVVEMLVSDISGNEDRISTTFVTQ